MVEFGVMGRARALAVVFLVALWAAVCLAPAHGLAATTCSVTVALSAGNSAGIDTDQGGACDNNGLGLFSGTGISAAAIQPIGYPAPQTVTGSKGNTYTLQYGGSSYTLILVSQVADGPETLTFGFYNGDGSDPDVITNGLFTINVSLPTLMTVPGAPTIGMALAAHRQVTVTFTAPASDGGAPIMHYGVTSTPGNLTGFCTSSPCTVPGLTNGTSYTFTVKATNSIGDSAASAASNSVTPVSVPGAPTIGAVSASNNQAVVNFTPPASDGGSPITGYVATSSPYNSTGSCTASPCIVSGLIGGQTYTFTVTASNAIGSGPSSAASAAVTVIQAPIASSFTYGATIPYNVGGASATSFSLSSHVANSPTSYGALSSATTRGGSVSIDNTGTVSYTPPVGFRGSDSFTYQALNSAGTSTAAVTVNVGDPTISVSLPASAGTVGLAYNSGGAAVAVTGGRTPYSNFSATGLPAGLSMSSSGVISGTPTASGSYSVAVTLTDSSTNPTGSGGYTATVVVPLNIDPASLSLPGTTLQAGAAGAPYSASLTAADGGVAPYHYAVTNGALPAGVTLTGTTLAGTPTAAGTFNFNVTVTDSSAGSDGTVGVTRGYSLVVAGPTLALSGSLPDATVDVPYSQTFTPSDGVAPYTLSMTGTLPAGMSFNAATGVFSGTPIQTGSFSLTVQAKDSTTGLGAPYTVVKGMFFNVLPATPPVASPAQVSTSTATPLTINVSSMVNGLYDSVVIVRQAQHGAAVVQTGGSQIQIVYTPVAGYSGSDDFTYAASGPGGTSAPAQVSVAVSPVTTPSASAKTLTVLSGRNVVLLATADALGAPFTAITVVAAPSMGTTAVVGETIVYTPNAGASGTDHFSYTLTNANGASLPIPVTVTVEPLAQVAPPIVLDILSGQTASANLTAKASGGPFTAATVVSVSPSTAGTTTITSPTAGAYTLTFTPANDFTGAATITYTLSNAFSTSAPGTVVVKVSARPDPSADAEVRGLVAAQEAAARRFANTQISNFNRRLEQLHNGGGAGGTFGVSLQGGDPDTPNGLEARERRRYAQLGQSDLLIDRSSLLPAGGQDAGGSAPTVAGRPSRWGKWVAGSADFGMRDAIGSQSGFRFTTDGLTAGVDYRVSERLAVGAGVGYGRDSSRIGQLGTKSQAESYSGGVYASLQPAVGMFIDGVAGYGSLDFSSRRYVTATGDLVYGDRSGDQVFASVTAGLEHHRGGLMISPYGRIGTTRSQLDAFTEVGGGPYGLTYQSQAVNTLTGALGLRGAYAYKVSFGQVAPRLRVEYAHDFEGVGLARLNYADWIGGPTYQLMIDGVDRDQTRIELGVDILVEGGLKIGLDFDNSLSANSNSQGMRLSISSGF